MHTSPAGIALIKEYEGFYPDRYDDGTGTRTIGYGTTDADIKPLPLHVTKAQATNLLKRGLAATYEPAVNALQLGLNQYQFDALVSFAYNLGPHAFTTAPGFQSLQHAVRVRDLPMIARALLLYDNPGTSVHAGLAKRRKAEHDLFLRPAGHLAGYPPDEQAWIHEYDDLKHRGVNPDRQRILQGVMSARAHEISTLALPKTRGGDGHGWDHNHRRERYRSLKARTTG